jgi:DNA-binding transcriptional MerR regulator
MGGGVVILQQDLHNRQQTARLLGLTYATLRVYEKNLGDLIQPTTGKNRTTLFSAKDIVVLRAAITLKNQGYRHNQIRDELLRREADRRSQSKKEEEEWEVVSSSTDPHNDSIYRSPGPGWFPFAADRSQVLWRRRKK